MELKLIPTALESQGLSNAGTVELIRKILLSHNPVHQKKEKEKL